MSDSQALAALRPATALEWHRVGKLVNNSRNKSGECNKPFELGAKPEKPKGMLAWLTGNKPQQQQQKVKSNSSEKEQPQQNTNVDVIKRSPTSPHTQNAAKRPRCELIKTGESAGITVKAEPADC